MARSHLVFDLDGTISDPAVGILRSINYALGAFGYDDVDESKISAYIGPPIDLTFRQLAQTDSGDHVLALVAKFRERYAGVGYSENSLYPGVADSLGALKARGARLGVCTSKRVDVAEKVLTLFGLRDAFDFVSGGEIGVSKSDQLSRLVSAGIVDTRSAMIGDRAVDVLAAKASSVSAVGVLWGHGSRAELVDAGADRLLSTPAELGELSLHGT